MTGLAVVGAMNAALVHEAAAAGADVYLTGQYRPSAAAAVRETGLGVIAVGHARSEAWGLTALTTALRLRFADLEVLTYRSPGPKAVRGANVWT